MMICVVQQVGVDTHLQPIEQKQDRRRAKQNLNTFLFIITTKFALKLRIFFDHNLQPTLCHCCVLQRQAKK